MHPFKSFEERRQRILDAEARIPIKVLTLNELLMQEHPPSSEDRLAGIPKRSWSPSSFQEAASVLRKAAGLNVKLLRSADRVPNLSRDVEFKYEHTYSECRERFHAGQKLLVAVVLEARRVVGFGIALLGKRSATVEIIDVDVFSRRSAGLKLDLEICGQSFSVGVGHLIVESLANAIKTKLKTDASNEASRYIFKSLGFVAVPRESNPCLLWKPS